MILIRVSIRLGYTTPSLFTTLPSPTICGLQASTTHFSDPFQKRDAANRPQYAFCWGQIKNVQRPTRPVFLRVSTAPLPEAALELPLCIL